MVRIMIRHRVKDYPAWRKIYDEFDETRKSLGTLDQAVYIKVDDPLDVTVTHDYADLETAKAFAGSTELREAMQRAGVDGQPQIWFVNPA
jgi:hypothetical protein